MHMRHTVLWHAWIGLWKLFDTSPFPAVQQHAVKLSSCGGRDCAALHHSHGLPEAEHGSCGPGQSQACERESIGPYFACIQRDTCHISM